MSRRSHCSEGSRSIPSSVTRPNTLVSSDKSDERQALALGEAASMGGLYWGAPSRPLAELAPRETISCPTPRRKKPKRSRARVVGLWRPTSGECWRDSTRCGAKTRTSPSLPGGRRPVSKRPPPRASSVCRGRHMASVDDARRDEEQLHGRIERVQWVIGWLVRAMRRKVAKTTRITSTRFARGL